MDGVAISLSTIVLNSRDWSEIVWLPEFSHFKINLAISFIRKTLAGMHCLGYNHAASSLNEAKSRIFQPTANFENFEIRLYFVSLPACQPACQPAVRPGCAMRRAPEISDSQGNDGGFTKLLFRFYYIHCAMVITLSFIILLCSSLLL